MSSFLRLAGVAAVALALPACATITRGTKETYVIETNPVGAQVALSTGQTCVSPCKLKLKRKDEFTAKITKEGYEPVEASVESKIQGGVAIGVAGNIIAGGLIGAVVDGNNGSMLDLTPNPLKVKLIPLKDAVAAPAKEDAAAPTTSSVAGAQQPN